MKIFKIKEDITSEIASSFKNSIAIDTKRLVFKFLPEINSASFKYVMKIRTFI